MGARIGEGAMGIVYRGVHPLLGRQAAVKVLRSESPDAAAQLLAEARLVAQARHPNIIDIFGFGTTDEGQPYFVMELLEGDALDLWLRARLPLAAVDTVGILKQLFSGLAAAHAANVVHRDLKPSNLFMARLADGTHFLKILDFGLSKRVDPASEGTRGIVVGTPLYMSPEQTVGDPCTPASDLYAAGCIAFELLEGRPPFTEPDINELLRQHREVAPPALSGEVQPLLRELVSSLLAKAPAQRPASATEVRAALERVERRLAAARASVQLPQIAGPKPERPTAPRPARAVPARPPPQPEDQATVPLETISTKSRRPSSSTSQERPTVRMEPLKTSSSKLAAAPAPSSSPSTVEVNEEQTEPREIEIPPPPTRTALPAQPSSKTWWIVGGVAVVLFGLLLVILFS